MMGTARTQTWESDLPEFPPSGETGSGNHGLPAGWVEARADPVEAADQPSGRVPSISVRAFCESPGVVSAIRQAADDRRLVRAEVTVSPGGLNGAVQIFAQEATPDLLVIETGLPGDALLAELEALAQVCDARTKVVVIGTVNDIALYRRLMERGIAEYLVAPVGTLGLINLVIKLFPQNEAARLGRVLAFIGAKGGAGSSTIAQNVAWSLAKAGKKVLLADLDLHFGTAALNFDIDAPVGFTEQFAGAADLDEALFERLLYKRGPRLSILAGPTGPRDIAPPALAVLDQILDRARADFPFVVLDLPHEWTPWVRQALMSADEVVVTAEPDLANLRNARTVFDLLKRTRPNDADPLLVLNRAGVAKRHEIKADHFAASLGAPVRASFDFAPRIFSKAGIGGQMIAEVSAAGGRPFQNLAQTLSGTEPVQEPRRILRWRRRT